MFQTAKQLPSKKLILLGIPLLLISFAVTVGLLYRFDHTRSNKDTALQSYSPPAAQADPSGSIAAAHVGHGDDEQPSSATQPATAPTSHDASTTVSVGSSAPAPVAHNEALYRAVSATNSDAPDLTSVAPPASQTGEKTTPPVVSSSAPAPVATDDTTTAPAPAAKPQPKPKSTTCSISLLGLCVSLGL